MEPVGVRRGQSATLRCLYDLDGAPLLSLQFYRGSGEFYRYSPTQSPTKKVFPLSGINVDVSSTLDYFYSLFYANITVRDDSWRIICSIVQSFCELKLKNFKFLKILLMDRFQAVPQSITRMTVYVMSGRLAYVKLKFLCLIRVELRYMHEPNR